MYSYCYPLLLCILIVMFIYSYVVRYVFRSGYSVSLFCSVYCLCVLYCTAATGCQTQLQLSSSSSSSMRCRREGDRWGVSERRSTYNNLVEKPTGRRLLERPRSRCRNILRCSFKKQRGARGLRRETIGLL